MIHHRSTRRHRFRTRGALALALLAGVTGLTVALAPSRGGARSAAAERPGDGVVFDYERITAREFREIGRPATVVLDDRPAHGVVTTLHHRGARVYAYLEALRFPRDRAYEGVDFATRPDLAFCSHGTQPLAARHAHHHDTWLEADLGERALFDAVVRHAVGLRHSGIDGVFVDLGGAALAGSGLWHRTSTCTRHAVRRGATVSDLYALLVRRLEAHGLRVILNYTAPGGDPLARPDPRDGACRVRAWDRCRFLHDLGSDTVMLHERALGGRAWRTEWSTLAHDAEAAPGRVIEMGVTARNASRARRAHQAEYLWAFGRLWDEPVAVNTGDDGCGTTRHLCERNGLFPALSSMRLGAPVDPRPQVVHHEGRVLLVRRFRQATVVVDPGAHRATVQRGQAARSFS